MQVSGNIFMLAFIILFILQPRINGTSWDDFLVIMSFFENPSSSRSICWNCDSSLNVLAFAKIMKKYDKVISISWSYCSCFVTAEISRTLGKRLIVTIIGVNKQEGLKNALTFT